MKDYVGFVYDPFNKYEGMFSFKKDDWKIQHSMSRYINWYKNREYVKGSYQDGIVYLEIPPTLMLEVREEVDFIIDMLGEFMNGNVPISTILVKKGNELISINYEY
ncbi:hypothetical protein Rm378p087 [Rhodothermus phage RM378]|uniref:hypothetical protein n=1 Tax=Rhodothermus phage RM378 TaxID=148943 RepID=UPI000018F659|nr:hypothetical protein Rm378p087 [Rhodothermus phage RM378]